MTPPPDGLTTLCVAVLAVDADLRRLAEERDAARRLALTLAVVSARLSRLAERPDRRDAT